MLPVSPGAPGPTDPPTDRLGPAPAVPFRARPGPGFAGAIAVLRAGASRHPVPPPPAGPGQRCSG